MVKAASSIYGGGAGRLPLIATASGSSGVGTGGWGKTAAGAGGTTLTCCLTGAPPQAFASIDAIAASAQKVASLDFLCQRVNRAPVKMRKPLKRIFEVSV